MKVSKQENNADGNINTINNIKINSYTFECLDSYKYFSTLISSKNDIYLEIQ